jgi:hypothetical protein
MAMAVTMSMMVTITMRIDGYLEQATNLVCKDKK